MSCSEYGNYVIRNFQSQGIYHHTGKLKLCLQRTRVTVNEDEDSVFDGLEDLK